MNLASWGVTSILLELMFGVEGLSLRSQDQEFPDRQDSRVGVDSICRRSSDGQNLLAYLALATAVWAYFFTYYSRAGLRIRSLGRIGGRRTAESVPVGIGTGDCLCGMLAGIAGTCLPLWAINVQRNMSAGKGYIALAAVLFGRGMPGPLIMASLLFGCAEALAVRMQGFGLPNQIMLMIPYIMTMVFLFLGTRETRRRSREG